jgi:hypothetical protein
MEEHSALLKLVRAVAVLDGVEAEVSQAGVPTGRGAHAPVISWPQIAELLGPDDPLDLAPRLRLGILLLLHRQVDLLGEAAQHAVRGAVRPLALPTEHPLHPGPEWVRESVPGGVLDLGIGVVGLLPGHDLLPLPTSVALAADLDVRTAWRRARARGDAVAGAAVRRLLTAPDRPTVLSSGAGTDEVDALTLLSLPAARDQLGGPVAAPSREQAWLGRRAWDEPYLQAVWMLTPAGRRGVREPLAVGPSGVTTLRPAQRSGERLGS